mmetsp:Transcript_34563/g.50618  ORF Transcript_34563/g.50618 Transcript_34563/m.50618 type:complete len:494 (+) Transcript_34563:178-1659(+)
MASELGNATVRLHGGIQSGNMKALANWGDLASLRDVRAAHSSGSLPDLGALGNAAGAGQNMSGVESAALPAVLRGLNVDVTSMHKVGCASLIAVCAAALADSSQGAPQVFVLASSNNNLKPIRNRLAEVSKETKITSFDLLSGHVCMGTATEALKSGGIKGAKLVVVLDADELSSGQGDTADRIAHLIDNAGGKRPQVLLVGTERAEKRQPKVKALQAKIVGSAGHVELTDGKDLFDFMKKGRLGVSAVVLSSLGVHDLQSLKTTDPRHLHDKLGAAVASKMTMELESHERKQASSGGVPPFDICSGQWEWTPDSKQAWQTKGLDPKYYHTEPDNSNWVFSFASQALLNAGYQPSYEAAPWDLDPNLLSGNGMGGSDAPDDSNEADAAWAEMYGQQGGGGGGMGYAPMGGFDMGGMQQALPAAAPTTRLSSELTKFLSGLQLNPAQCRTLAGVLERSGVQRVNELREMRWSLTQSLGIDYGLACAIAQGLDQY